MPESRGRKPKTKPITLRTKAITKRPRRSRWGWLITAFTLLAGAVGFLVLLPAVMIEPSNAPETSNPFSGVFKVMNEQFYPLQHVHIQAYLWCVKMGTGTDTSRPSMCEKGNIASSRPEWNKDIAPHGSRQIIAGEALYGTSHAILYAEISMKMSYTPWFLPIQLEREDTFYTRRKDNGDVEWLSK